MEPLAEKRTLNWRFIGFWCLATTVGWTIGLIAMSIRHPSLFEANPQLYIPVGMSIAGLALGLGQWPVLLKRLRGAAWWVLASVLGWGTIGFFYWLLPDSAILNIPFVIFVSAAVLAAMGQWLVLRRQVRRAGWWIVGSAVGWLVMTLCLKLVSSLSSFYSEYLNLAQSLSILFSILLTGAAAGLLTGLVLSFLLFRSQVPEARLSAA